MVNFGKCLRKAQEQKRVSSSQLARKIGVHRQQVCIWRSQDNCKLDTVIRVCDALEYKVDEFINLEDKAKWYRPNNDL